MMSSVMSNGPPKDHVEGEGGYEDEPAAHDAGYEPDSGRGDRPRRPIDENLRIRATWQRLLFMFVMALLFSLGVTVGCVLVLLQFFWVLFTGETKPEFVTVGRQLAEYSREIVLYMSFASEERPFPFDRPWPSGDAG